MPQRVKTSAEEKVRIVDAYLSGEVRWTDAYEVAGVGKATVNR